MHLPVVLMIIGYLVATPYVRFPRSLPTVKSYGALVARTRCVREPGAAVDCARLERSDSNQLGERSSFGGGIGLAVNY